MGQTQVFPVLPLRDSVMFPDISMPIVVGRPGTLRAIEAALNGDGRIVVASQRENLEEPTPEHLYNMGVISHITQVQKSLNGIQLVLVGEARARVNRFHFSFNGYLTADVSLIDERELDVVSDPSQSALFKEIRERAIALGKRRGLSEEVLHRFLDPVTDPGKLCDLVVGYSEEALDEKQRLLEVLDPVERMHEVLLFLERQIAVFDAQAEIKTHVQEELGEKQRQFYLREQMRAIQKALGEDDQSKEVTDLRRKLEALVLPKEARAEVDRELNRLERTGRESMEAQVIRTYLEWMAELPWATRTNDDLDLKRATVILDEDHYGLQDVKDRVLEHLAVRQLRAARDARESAAPPAPVSEADPAARVEEVTETRARALARGPIMLFIGPPGVGKTSIAKSIARSLGRKYTRAALGGVRDEADVRGHRRTYVGAMPGRIIQGMKQAGTKNPVFLLDEIDKLGASFQGDPASALLEVLDPAQNDTFTDHYMNVPFDLSEVLFICTANFIQHIPAPLLDRMEVIDFSGYTEREKAEIAKRYLIPRQLDESGLSDRGLHFTDDAVSCIVSHYTREAGVRQLEREIGAVARKLARALATGNEISPEISPDVVRSLLGRPKVHPERAGQTNEVGVATGLYYTPAGGDIMFVEAAVRKLMGGAPVEETASRDGLGNISLILTGQLGDVMKESARAALTYAATHAVSLHIPHERLGTIEVHIHVPAGAIPKDGPSAGIAMATAIASALSGRPVRRDVAMTGEITLRGRVLPIGGVKEKVLGALRAGIAHVALPKENEADLEDLPPEARNGLTFHFVETLDEVFQLLLLERPHEMRAASRRVERAGATVMERVPVVDEYEPQTQGP